tara:strand:+ start:314 stop:784 length:471 start_codon:yes stop_codon:yes gene_type:complete
VCGARARGLQWRGAACLSAGASSLVPDALALLLDVEAKVLEENHGAVLGVRARILNVGARASGHELHGRAHELLQPLGDGEQRHRRVRLAVGPAEVRHEDHGLRAAVERELDRRDGAIDALVVRDRPVLLLCRRAWCACTLAARLGGNGLKVTMMA